MPFPVLCYTHFTKQSSFRQRVGVVAKKSPKGRRRTGPAAWVWVLVGVLAAAVLVAGYAGIGNTPSNNATNPVPGIHHKAPATRFPAGYRAYALKTGSLTHLKRGSRLTVVMLMASWCLYCAYDDKYVWPTIIHTPGLQLDIIDVSPYSGIGNPGPESPAFTGHDNPGPKVGVAGMRTTMSAYVRQFGLQYSNVNVYVDPTGMQYWSVQDFPTVLFVNQKGQLVERVNGALTQSSAQRLVKSLLKQG